MSNGNHWDAQLNARDRRNVKPIKLYALLWAISFLLAVLMLPVSDGMVFGQAELSEQPVWAWILAAIPIPLGVMLTHYYLRYIRQTDELMRKIHLEALATGFGVAFVFGMGFILFGQLGLERFSGLTWHLMLIAYIWKLRSAQREYSE